MINVLSSVGMKGALDQLNLPGSRISFGTAVPLKRRIDAGASFDVVLLPPSMLADLARQGKVDPASVQVVAKSGMGVGIRRGAPKPDIASAQGFTKALLGARSIAYSREGQSGMLMAALIERLGLAAALAPKTLFETRPGGAAFNLAEGKAELALTILSEILPVPGAELAGPLPAELQQFVFFAAGVSPAANQKAARAFVDFLKSPAAIEALRANGMEPP